MLPDTKHTLEKYLHLGDVQEPSETNAAAFNLQQLQYLHSGTKAKVKVRAQVSHVHLVATSSVGRAADLHVKGPGFNTHSQLNLARVDSAFHPSVGR